MIELYMVQYSCGSYDDYTVNSENIIYATLEAAEFRRNKLIEEMKEITTFPFDWCTQEEFEDLLYEGKIVDSDKEIYDKWNIQNLKSSDFNTAWIYNLLLDSQSWRDRQLKNIID